MLLRIVAANALPLPAAVSPGIRFAVQRVLPFGIVLLGARLSLDAVLAIGVGALGLALAAIRSRSRSRCSRDASSVCRRACGS